MRAASRSDDRVDLVDDDSGRRPEHLAAALRRQEQVQRLGRRHQDVRRRSQHRGALALGRIAGAHGGGDARWGEAGRLGERANRAPRLGEILVNVRAQRLQRRHVDDADFVGQRRAQPFLKQIVERRQKRRERLAGPRRRRDERVPPLANRRPAAALRVSRLAERLREPLSSKLMEVRQ